MAKATTNLQTEPVYSINVSYKITDKDEDGVMLHKIVDVAAKYELYCQFGVTSFSERYFYLSGEKNLVIAAYMELEEI